MGWRSRRLDAGMAFVLVAGFCLAALSAGSRPARAAERGVVFGDLVIRHDDAVWDLVPAADGFTARCRHRDCEGRLVRGTVTDRPICEPDLSREPGDEPSRREITTLENAGLSWRIESWYRGCRNGHPRSLIACAVHGGRAYRVAALLLSCRTAPLTASEGAIVTLIRGIGTR